MKKVAIGADPNANVLKDTVKKHLTDLGYEYEDYGSDDPIYANVAFKVAEAVALLHGTIPKEQQRQHHDHGRTGRWTGTCQDTRIHMDELRLHTGREV